MSVIQDNELVLYKAVAEHIKNGLAKPLKNINSKCNSELLKFEKQKSKFMTSETYEDLGDSSKSFKTRREELILLLAVQDRLDKIASRNEQRIEFISSRLNQMGIYNDTVDKKTLTSAISAEKENVSEESLNLNPGAKGGVTFKYFAGEILAFKDGELDFGLIENKEVLVEGSAEFVHEVIETFPYSVGTIPKSFYVISNVKNKVLKECILYVASKIKTQTIAESNRQLGNLLENVTEISSFNQFVSELKNYFNVIVKQYLKEKLPSDSKEIDETIYCNETSIFLPKDMRVVGAKPPVKKNDVESQVTIDEQQDKTDESAENEQKNDDEVSKEELLDLLLNDDEKEISDSDINSNDETKEESTIDDDIKQTLRELEELLNSQLEDDDKKED